MRALFLWTARMRKRVVILLAGAAVMLPALALAQTKTFSGRAAYYGDNYKGKTASGQIYDGAKFTAAHKTLPFGTRLRVTDARTGRSVVVVVNDRGPFTPGRVIDLSLAAATSLGMITRGVIPVNIEHITE
jgi:rare lipoprotein A